MTIFKEQQAWLSSNPYDGIHSGFESAQEQKYAYDYKSYDEHRHEHGYEYAQDNTMEYTGGLDPSTGPPVLEEGFI
ncbi:hypothetical protein [Paenibacillus sp. y28]|uniref:hypothetical protein n=1 Tax=Paenibacillus sp. y28 TaxID=3129110 RepID=UPI00301858CA